MGYNYPDGDDFFGYGRDPQSGYDADLRRAEKVDPPQPEDRWVIRITAEGSYQTIGIAKADHRPTLEKTTQSVRRDSQFTDIPVLRVDILAGPMTLDSALNYATGRCVGCLAHFDDDGDCPNCAEGVSEFCNWWIITDGHAYWGECSNTYPTAESVSIPGEFEPSKIHILAGPMTNSQNTVYLGKLAHSVPRSFPENLDTDELEAQFPRLLRRMQWIAILSRSEASSALRSYLLNRKYGRAMSYGGEAVAHYGGPDKVVTDAAGPKRHYMPKGMNFLKPKYYDAWIDYAGADDEIAPF